jgi:peptidoglycan/LPS O-acetylase OafA/YrhL
MTLTRYTLPRKIPSLDGLRAVSIGLVILSHLTLYATRSGLASTLLIALTENGRWGVSVFFVISGFLITTLLMREEEQDGSVSLKGFYIRRAFRILPAFLVYLAVVGVLRGFGVVSVSHDALLHAFTFTSDYSGSTNSWFTAHTWSLSVEEQFYLLWPPLFVVFRRKMQVRFAAAVILIDPLVRMGTWFAFRVQHMNIKYMGHTRADMLMFGCIVALLFPSPAIQKQFAAWQERKKLLFAALFFFLVGSPLIELALGPHFKEFYMASIGFTLQGAAITLLMLYTILNPKSWAGRLLNSRAMIYIGVRSYSLYLWQQLFIGSRSLPLGRSLLALCAAALAAEASYRFVEAPMLRARRRFESESDVIVRSVNEPFDEFTITAR